MEERIDLGPGQALRHPGDADRCVVLLPGRFYPTRAPALWFVREAAMALGWSALEVLGEPGEHDDPLAWERSCAQAALDSAGAGRLLVVGKSMATLLAGEVAERELPAVWLTPLLNETEVIDGLAATSRPTLLAGGNADPTWRPEAIPADRPIEALELPGVDHGFQVPGDPVASLHALGRLTEAVTQFVERV
jgi:hypothetical protein